MLKENQTLRTYGILTETRPWGKFEVLLNDENVKVKRITVNPERRLSYQSHEKRSEVWTVVKGTLVAIIDGYEVVRGRGQSVKIPLGAKHRAWNKTNAALEFIEVQTGTYFGEDEITRYEEDYQR